VTPKYDFDFVKTEQTYVMRLVIQPRKFLLFLIFSILILSISACEGESAGLQTFVGYDQVDPLFREFYEHLGGEGFLGPSISPAFDANGVKYQYTSASLMVYDPQASASRRFHLAPLGIDLGVYEPAVPPPSQPGSRYIEGHIIYDGFIEFYDKAGGARFLGSPITEVHLNPETRRYEQHFENVGLYRIEGEDPGIVHALDYGAWKCSASCRPVPPSNSLVIVHPQPGDLFREAANRMGTDFTGFALTEPYSASDGLVEQVFENMVLAVDPANPGPVILRPITTLLGILPDPLVSPLNAEEYYFYPLQGALGHNIPLHFLEAIEMRGGMGISGQPLTERTALSDRVFRQCFANLCLEEHHNASGAIWVHPAPLGYSYRSVAVQGGTQAVQPLVQESELPTPTMIVPPAVLPETAPTVPVEQPTTMPPAETQPIQEQPTPLPPQPTIESFTDSQNLRAITIQVWESYPILAVGQGQEIGVAVFENNLPMRSIEPDLVLTLPDGATRTYYLFPTGEDGQTRMPLDPITAPNGTLIPYQVCILNLMGEQFCVKDSFLIWDNP
jgi:hypothetical protein